MYLLNFNVQKIYFLLIIITLCIARSFISVSRRNFAF